MSQLTLLHLSDIHFRRNSNSPHDGNKDLRDELERDAVELSKRLGGIRGVLISGDIAFSGHEDEYKIAYEWLKRLSDLLGFDPVGVWMTPGNHDVDRSVIFKSMLLRDIHNNLRSSAAEIDDKLAGYLGADEEAAKLVYRPIQQYADFAAKFECEISAKEPFWEEDLFLNDGSILRIRGVNSTLVSDDLDSDLSYKLIVGKRQLELTRQDGVEYLILCHHPPQWLLDQDGVEDLLRSRARIQLFGHKHRQRLEQIDQTLRVSSGATHPDKREPSWQPRFNLLQLSVEQADTGRRMKVVVYPRVFSEERTTFMPDFDVQGQEFREYVFPLPPWQAPGVQAGAKATTVPCTTATPVAERGSQMRAGRKLAYRFLSLPHHAKLKIAQQLNLIQEEDQGLRDSELYKRYFARAAEAGILAELWQAVQREHGDKDEDNPFETTSGAT